MLKKNVASKDGQFCETDFQFRRFFLEIFSLREMIDFVFNSGGDSETLTMDSREPVD